MAQAIARPAAKYYIDWLAPKRTSRPVEAPSRKKRNDEACRNRQNHPASLGRDILALGIAYARQERRYGGLSKPVVKGDRLSARVLRDGATDAPPSLR
jgi:hypothetical protein